ncbi:MAG: hypothetical protein J1F42_09260 [Lachnospiraceae bacterium]|nr:hypothetical protein [Lachnospiraceae bacterium]
MTNKEKMHNIEPYLPNDSEILEEQMSYIEPSLHANWGGPPLLPELREKGYQYNAPVHIGRSCWLGAGVITVPGINDGDNVVIGAGSIVTKDIPSNVLAAGNPCKVLREINEHDKEHLWIRL